MCAILVILTEKKQLSYFLMPDFVFHLLLSKDNGQTGLREGGW